MMIGPIWRFCLLLALISCWAGATRSAFADDAPKVEVTSRAPNEGTVHVIGFLEGTNLKSAGIFDHGEKLKDIDVAGTPGSQRVNFNFAIEAPSPTMTIEVTDMMGRSASAQVMPTSAGAPTAEAESSFAGGESSERTEGVAPSPAASASGNTVEIPRYGGGAALSRRPNPRFAGGVGNPMSNVEINVMSVLPLLSKPGNYEVTGQIVGVGVRRAGIYVAGRPVKPIPVSVGRFSPFDVVFPLTGGRDATIRAYGAGREYVELPIDVNGPTTMYNSPYGGSRSLVNPYGPNP
jgi:hypothetical protein